MIKRSSHITEVISRLKTFEVVAIIGPRQIGKTTLARQVAEQYHTTFHHFDLEDPTDLERLQSDPKLVLMNLKGLIIIDEIQRLPQLFTLLRVLADRRPRQARFLVLGSASSQLLQQSSESLAGRINYFELGGLRLDEVGGNKLNRLWLRGGFPDAYLARTNQDCFQWLESFTRTFLERDLAQLGIRTPATTLRRFWTMLAHWHAQIWNSSEFARSFGVADTTIRHYLDVLTDTLVIRQLQPWHANIKKRQVKAPKIYLRDSGLVHSLLRINDMRTLESHPKLGASWEGLMIDLIMEKLRPKRPEYYFWATHTGAELDLFILHGQKRLGIEIKRTTSPGITSSMRTAQHDLKLSELIVVHAGDASYPLGENVRAVSANQILEDL